MRQFDNLTIDKLVNETIWQFANRQIDNLTIGKLVNEII